MPTRDRFAVAASSVHRPAGGDDGAGGGPEAPARRGPSRRPGDGRDRGRTGGEFGRQDLRHPARLCGARSPQRLSEIAASTGLNKVTALRIIDTLIQEGFVDAARRSGPRLSRAAANSWRSRPRPAARTTSARTRPAEPRAPRRRLSEDTASSCPSGAARSRSASTAQIGSFPIRANYLDLGSRRPLGRRGGLARAPAWLPDREIEAILDASRRAISRPIPRLRCATIRGARRREPGARLRDPARPGDRPHGRDRHPAARSAPARVAARSASRP